MAQTTSARAAVFSPIAVNLRPLWMNGSIAATRTACRKHKSVHLASNRRSTNNVNSRWVVFAGAARKNSHRPAAFAQRGKGVPQERHNAISASGSSEAVTEDNPEAVAHASWTRKLVLMATSANALADLDKICLSVAIIPMAAHLGWNSAVVGSVHSAFFLGFLAMQIPGGILSEFLGGRKILPIGVLLWSVATIAAPFSTEFLSFFLVTRFVVGLGEGFAPTSLTDVLAKWVPERDRTNAAAQIFTGQNFGNAIGLILTPMLLTYFGGYQTVFYTFGVLGLAWAIAWQALWRDPSRPQEPVNADPNGWRGEGRDPNGNHVVPWGAFFRTKGVWAVIAAHFADNWAKFALTAWLPTYFTHYGISLTHASMLALVPPIAGIMVAGFAGPAATAQIRAGRDITTVRRNFMLLALLLPAGCLLGASVLIQQTMASIFLVIAAIALSRFCVASLYCIHADMSPKHSAPLLGITNTAGAFAGVLSSKVVGGIFQQTGSWQLALFGPTIAIYIIGAAIFSALIDVRPHNFDAVDGEDIVMPREQRVHLA